VVDGLSAPSEPLHLAEAGLLTMWALGEAPLVVALPAGHPLARRAEVDLDAFADAPWVAPPYRLALRSATGEPPPRSAGVAYAGSDLPTILTLVAAGLGVALLPQHPWLAHLGVVAVPLRTPTVVHRTELLTRRTVGTAEQRVVDALRAAAAR
jgi:DNA-binding transcriptional LysR family regulator